MVKSDVKSKNKPTAAAQPSISSEFDNEIFEQAGTVASGASYTIPKSAGSLRPNGFVVINNRPCKIIDICSAKNGKHGHAKTNITAVDIFTGRRYEDSCPTAHNIEVPVVKKEDYQVMLITTDNDNESNDNSGGEYAYLTVMNAEGEYKNDLKLPLASSADSAVNAQELMKKVDEGAEMMVTVLRAMGEEMIITSREFSASK